MTKAIRATLQLDWTAFLLQRHGIDFRLPPAAPELEVCDGLQQLWTRESPLIPARALAFLVVPLVGAFFIDLVNAIVIKTFAASPLLEQPIR